MTLNSILKPFGFAIRYRDSRGYFEHRYGPLDHASQRPIHYDLPIAFPWAKPCLIRLPKDAK